MSENLEAQHSFIGVCLVFNSTLKSLETLYEKLDNSV